MNMTVMGAALAACALLSAGQERLHSKGLPSFPGVLEIRSNLPGRIRMEVPSVRKAPEKADVMKKTLLETGVFREITVNPVTGSVLFCYDADKIEPEVVEGVAVRLLGLDQAIEKRPESIVHQGIKSLCRGVDNGIYDATGGLISGRTAAGIALIVTAVNKSMASGLTLPGAATLLWWASGILGRGAGRE